MKKLLVAVVLTAVVGLSGCGTIYQGIQHKGPAIFGGIRLNVQQFGHEQSHAGDIVFYCLDMPFSLAGDAVLLLASVINELYEGGIDVYPQHPKTLGNPAHVAFAEPDELPAGPELATVRGQ
jgi:uncharacterized protein YceK